MLILSFLYSFIFEQFVVENPSLFLYPYIHRKAVFSRSNAFTRLSGVIPFSFDIFHIFFDKPLSSIIYFGSLSISILNSTSLVSSQMSETLCVSQKSDASRIFENERLLFTFFFLIFCHKLSINSLLYSLIPDLPPFPPLHPLPDTRSFPSLLLRLFPTPHCQLPTPDFLFTFIGE